MVFLDDQRRQRSRHAGRRGAQLRARRATAARFLLKDAVDEGRRSAARARRSWQRERGWNLLCKFFDNMGADSASHAPERRRRRSSSASKGKPEAYYFPPQYNKIDNNFPYTFMGLEPGTTKADVRRCLENWNKGDNGILDSLAGLPAQARHRLADQSRHPARARVARHLRAAGEQRRVRDVPVGGRRAHHAVGPADEGRAAGVSPRPRLSSSSMLDWDANVNPTFAPDNRCFPKPVKPFARDRARRLSRAVGVPTARGWYSAKELTVLPKRTVTIKDAAAYGIILTQGYGTLRHAHGLDAVDDPLRRDDGGRAVRHRRRGAQGVKIENLSETDPLVILKHFGPGIRMPRG